MNTRIVDRTIHSPGRLLIVVHRISKPGRTNGRLTIVVNIPSDVTKNAQPNHEYRIVDRKTHGPGHLLIDVHCDIPIVEYQHPVIQLVIGPALIALTRRKPKNAYRRTHTVSKMATDISAQPPAA